MINKIIEKIKNNLPILLASIQVIIGAVLLVREIQHFTVLISRAEAIEQLISLVKSKECTYRYFYLWTLLLLSGISYWINAKLYWVFTQIALITIFFVIVSNFILILSDSLIPLLGVIIILAVFVAVLFTFFKIFAAMYKKTYLKTIGIKDWMKWISVCLGIISYGIYFTLKWYVY